MLAGCSPTESDEPPADGDSSGKYSWETPPEPIAESEITETIETDVVIVVAGLSELAAAARAAEEGANVVVIEKGNSWSGRGGHFGVVESREMEKANLVNDKYQLAREWISK